MKHECLEKFLADARTYLGLDKVPERSVEEPFELPRRGCDPIAPRQWRQSLLSDQPQRSPD
jgi:hypothetical protein